MCEIAIIDPRDTATGKQLDIVTSIYERMGDGAGIVYVSESDDRSTFEYDVYKSATPHPDVMREFIHDHSDGAIRCVMHGRLATCGDVSDTNTHPLEIECDECDMEYVVHNGMAYNHRRRRRRLQEQGHTFQTAVDSEIIGHTFGEVPPTFDDADSFFEGQPAFVLLGRQSVYIHASKGYHLTKRGFVARTHRHFGPDTRSDNYQKVILTPTNAK